jgi:hypothetical protein
VRLPAAPYQTRSAPPPVYAFMVRTVYTCGLPQPSCPVAWVVSGAGVSSVPSTSAAFRAFFSASSNPAACRASSRRTRQAETNPVETGAPSRVPIRSAARSIPITSAEASSVAAASTFGP